MIDKTLMNTMLFDFFGEMLTEKQKKYFDLYYNDDLSLSEIAESTGITKQGVYDILKRAKKMLEYFESKTGIIQKWYETRIELKHVIESGEIVHPVALHYFKLEEEE